MFWSRGREKKRQREYGDRGRKGRLICFLAVMAVIALSACGYDTNVASPSIVQIMPENGTDPAEPLAGNTAGEPVQDPGKDPAADQKSEGDGSPGEGAAAENGGEDGAEEDGSNCVTITISAAGDVTMGNYVGQEYSRSFREMYSTVDHKEYFFENVYDIFSQDDLTIVNLEGVLTFSDNMAPDRTYNIKGDPEYVDLLTYGSVEAVSMANNHRQDFGEEGTKDTVAALESAGIVYAYDKIVGIYEVKGVRIGFVSVNEVSWGQGVERLMKDGIAQLEEEGVDLILACCHWGTERVYDPEEYQQTFGRKCIDWGADLVIGHHPHVLQGVEEYQGKYIVYSLGNFCFGANRNPSDKDCMIVQQTFTFIDGEKQKETEFCMIPCSVSSVSDRNDYRPTPAAGEEAARIIDRVNQYSKNFGVQFAENGYVIR